MGSSPVPAVISAAPASAQADAPPVQRFGMAHAVVIVVCILTAAALGELGMPVKDVLFLLGGAGSIGASILLIVVTGGRTGSRFGRFLRAYLNSSGS